jgi:hypothetical protein
MRQAGQSELREILDTIPCCRVHRRFRLLRDDEEPLCRGIRTESEVYRFAWHSSFDGEAVVRIGEPDSEITLRWVYHWFRAPSPDDSPPSVPLTLADWTRLQEAFIAASFWALDPDEGPLARGLDGAFWTIEGRRKDMFRAVSRWSPRDEAVHDLARLFFDLAGPPLGEIKLY